MSSWESYPMYTLKGISFVASAWSLFDILLFNFSVGGVLFCAEKKTKNKKTKKGRMDG